MRIPHIINRNTIKAYEASPESLNLIGEEVRKLLSEDFEWDKEECPYLIDLCVEALAKNFENKQILDELYCPDRNYLIEILGVDLPLSIVIPLIDDEHYWKRRFDTKFGIDIEPKPKNWEWNWKNLYIERHMQDLIEQAQPEHNDEDEMAEITTLCAPFIRRLLVKQLQCWKPPLHWDEEDIPEFWPIDHIDFNPILKNLPNIEEFEVIYGVKNIGEKFTWNMFKVTVNDTLKLGKAVNYLKSLRILRLHRSRMEDAQTRALMQGLFKNQTIEELDLSNCLIGDQGALCLAKVLTVHPTLKKLDLTNNRIGKLGSEGIGFALLNPDCVLETLNIKLNPLFEDGAMGIYRALVRGGRLIELNMAVCQFEDDAPIRTGQMILLNNTLKKLDVSNNWFDEDGGKMLVDGLTVNTTLEWLDIRETDITEEQIRDINKLLKRNRNEEEEIEEEEQEEEEIKEEEETKEDGEPKEEEDTKEETKPEEQPVPEATETAAEEKSETNIEQ